MPEVHPESPKILRFQPYAGLELALLDLDAFAVASGLTAKREVEQQGALYVVRSILQRPDCSILYEDNGRPYLTSGPSISISHSYNKLAVLFSDKAGSIGIDIEKVREKILSIKEKFLSPNELKELERAPLEKYTVYWCAKEAVYKAAGIDGLIFAEQLLVEPFVFSAQGGKLTLQLRTGDATVSFPLAYSMSDSFALVYTQND